MIDGPLDGVRVIELSEGVAGPMTARLLGDAGADVVKIETAGGDRTRGWGPFDRGQTNVVFTAVNRNKRSVVLGEQGGAALTTLLSSADVLIVDAGQLDVTAIMAAHPDLVVSVISGWGPNGPWAELPGGELAAQLASEATASLGQIGDEPVRIAHDHASMLAASFAVQGIVAALLVCEEVGGQRVDVSLFGALMQMRATMWVALSNPDTWGGFHLDSSIKPPECGYTCKDRHIYFSLGRVVDVEALVAELGMDFVFDDPRWTTLRTDRAGGLGPKSHLVHDLWDRGLSKWTYAEAAEIIERHGGWAFPYLDYAEFLDDEHVRQMGLVLDVPSATGATVREPRPPWQFAETPASIRRPAPTVGQHTREVLDGLAQGLL